jgi:hypothetical protein
MVDIWFSGSKYKFLKHTNFKYFSIKIEVYDISVYKEKIYEH